MSELKPYTEWIAAGRAVQAGEKAAWYSVAPDGHAYALFSEEQTQPAVIEDRTGWEIVPVDVYKARKGKREKPFVKIAYNSETKQLSVWCGNNKKAIELLREAGFKFNPNRYRWVAERAGIEKTYAGWVARGYEVTAALDGQPWHDGPVL